MTVARWVSIGFGVVLGLAAFVADPLVSVAAGVASMCVLVGLFLDDGEDV